MQEFLRELYEYFGIDKTIGVPMVVSTFTSILVVILGVIIAYFQECYNHYRTRKQNQEIMKDSLRNLVRQVNKQAVNYKIFANQLNINHLGSYNFQFTVLYDLEVFRQLDYITTREAFLSGWENKYGKRLNAHDYNQLIKIVKYLIETHEYSITKSSAYIQESAALNELRNDALAAVQLNIETFRIKFVRELSTSEPLGQFFDQRERIIESWQNKENHTLPTLAEEYIQGLISLNRANVDLIHRYENDIRSVELNSNINRASLRYENMKNHLASASEYYKFIAGQYFENAKKLQALIRKLH